MSTNSVTGDALISKPSNENYLNNYDLIFRKKEITQLDNLLENPKEEEHGKSPEGIPL